MGSETDGHRYFEGLAVAHVLGGLDESDGRVFRSHLLECSDCRARVGELRALAHDLADVERDERRVRAAKTIETKRRERAEDDEEEEPPLPAPGLRYPRLLALAGVLALIGLALWNYTLREEISNQQVIVDTVTDAAELLETGQPVSTQDLTISDDRVDARVHTDEGRAVLLVTGLPDDASHAIYQVDGSNKVVDTYTMRSTDHRLFVLVALRDETRKLWVTRPRTDDTEPVEVLTADLRRGGRGE